MVIFIDVDDTLIRSIGNKRIPIPATLDALHKLHQEGHTLYCWSRGGAAYAQSVTDQLAITHLFAAIIAKPDQMIDDESWQQLTAKIVLTHPNQLPL
jgi:hydroxymethylpyrimidine pyrophosphatase-like HAD family hydrolase